MAHYKKEWMGNSGFSVIDDVTGEIVAEVQMDTIVDTESNLWIVFELLGVRQYDEEVQYFSTAAAAFSGIVEHLECH